MTRNNHMPRNMPRNITPVLGNPCGYSIVTLLSACAVVCGPVAHHVALFALFSFNQQELDADTMLKAKALRDAKASEQKLLLSPTPVAPQASASASTASAGLPTKKKADYKDEDVLANFFNGLLVGKDIPSQSADKHSKKAQKKQARMAATLAKKEALSTDTASATGSPTKKTPPPTSTRTPTPDNPIDMHGPRGSTVAFLSLFLLFFSCGGGVEGVGVCVICAVCRLFYRVVLRA